MKSQKILHEETQDTTAITRRNLKKFFYLICLTGTGLFFTGCEMGYVATEPTYTENVRPAQPSNLHVWVDGDWVYSRQTHGYVRNNGYWQQPSQGRSYVSGHWQTTPKGHYWTKGHWQRNRR